MYTLTLIKTDLFLFHLFPDIFRHIKLFETLLVPVRGHREAVVVVDSDLLARGY